MPKGKARTQEEYDKEVEEAAKRMRKYPEHLRSARTSGIWSSFLTDIGVNPENIESDKGSSFWEKVRKKIDVKPRKQAPKLSERRLEFEKKLEKRNIAVVTGTLLYRSKSGKFTTEKTEASTIVTTYRDKKTGRFTSGKNL